MFSYTFADPSTDGESATSASSNCNKEDYVVAGSEEEFPPANTLLPWDKVATNPTEKKIYALCGLTYDIAYKNYFSVPGTSKAEEETVKQYLQFVTAKKGGELSLAGHDYLALPANVLAEADAGAAEINYTE